MACDLLDRLDPLALAAGVVSSPRQLIRQGEPIVRFHVLRSQFHGVLRCVDRLRITLQEQMQQAELEPGVVGFGSRWIDSRQDASAPSKSRTSFCAEPSRSRYRGSDHGVITRSRYRRASSEWCVRIRSLQNSSQKLAAPGGSARGPGPPPGWRGPRRRPPRGGRPRGGWWPGGRGRPPARPWCGPGARPTRAVRPGGRRSTRRWPGSGGGSGPGDSRPAPSSPARPRDCSGRRGGIPGSGRLASRGRRANRPAIW